MSIAHVQLLPIITAHVQRALAQSGSSGLFTKFVNKFLTIKEQSSGFPPGCVTEADKDEYIDCYQTIEGISLDKVWYRRTLAFDAVVNVLTAYGVV